MDVISGHHFMKLADICICEPNINHLLRNDVKKIYNIDNVDKNQLKSGKIIFVKTDYVMIFFHRYYKFLGENVTIITHNSDYEIVKSTDRLINLSKIRKWYAQNTKFLHPKLHSIPIGIANPQYPHGNSELLNKVKDKKLKKENLLYINFTINTNRKIRQEIFQIFKDRPNDCNKNLSQEQYLDNLSSSKYCLSPPGNGTDCHRIWEALYLDTIPIVMDNIAFEQFKDLPILFISDWSDVNNNFLNNKYEEISKRKRDKIYIDFWKNEISS